MTTRKLRRDDDDFEVDIPFQTLSSSKTAKSLGPIQTRSSSSRQTTLQPQTKPSHSQKSSSGSSTTRLSPTLQSGSQSLPSSRERSSQSASKIHSSPSRSKSSARSQPKPHKSDPSLVIDLDDSPAKKPSPRKTRQWHSTQSSSGASQEDYRWLSPMTGMSSEDVKSDVNGHDVDERIDDSSDSSSFQSETKYTSISMSQPIMSAQKTANAHAHAHANGSVSDKISSSKSSASINQLKSKRAASLSPSPSSLASSFDCVRKMEESRSSLRQLQPSNAKKTVSSNPASMTFAPGKGSSSSQGSRQPSSHIPKELWVEKYTPQTEEDLAVIKKRIAEVKQWFELSLGASSTPLIWRQKLLVLAGPSGCGKSATVRVLCKQQGIDIVEWLNPVNYTIVDSEGKTKDADLLKKFDFFEEFMFRSRRYKSVMDDSSKRIILLEDLSTLTVEKHIEMFHQLLKKYLKISTTPVILILSESTTGEKVIEKFLPKDIIDSPQVHFINFIPVNKTSMTKVLFKIAATENISISKSDAEQLTENYGGDLRSTINALQLIAQTHKNLDDDFVSNDTTPNSNSKSSGNSSSRKKAKTSSTKSPIMNDITLSSLSRDVAFSPFHALGKFLYEKREPSFASKESQPIDLPDHLVRRPLTINPEQVIDNVVMDTGSIQSFLFENYIDFFGDALDESVSAASYLSDSEQFSGIWKHSSLLSRYASSVAARGVIFSNEHLAPSRFRPLNKPMISYVNRAKQDMGFQVARFCRKEEYIQTQITQGNVLTTETLPFLHTIKPGYDSVINELCTLNTRHCPESGWVYSGMSSGFTSTNRKPQYLAQANAGNAQTQTQTDYEGAKEREDEIEDDDD